MNPWVENKKTKPGVKTRRPNQVCPRLWEDCRTSGIKERPSELLCFHIHAACMQLCVELCLDLYIELCVQLCRAVCRAMCAAVLSCL